MPPAYSAKAFRGLGYLKKSGNSVEIYGEDISLTNAYVNFFRKLLPTGAQLKSVVAVGSKEKVLEICRNDQTEHRRRRLYVIDGDLDLIAGVRKPKLKHLYRLNSYCFENLLLSEEAVIDVASRLSASDDAAALKGRLNWTQNRDQFAQSFWGMYRLYAAINFLTNEQRPVTVGYSVEAMCSKSADGRRVPDPKKIRARYRALFSYLFSKVSKETYSKFRQKLAKLAKARRIGISRLVSGKSCLLKHLHALMKGVAKFRGDEKQLVAMLAASTSPRAEPGLRRVLTKICS